jgi:hypothetical protein
MTTTTINGVDYELFILDGVLNTREVGGIWAPHPQMIGVFTANLLGPWIVADNGGGVYHSTRIDNLSIYDVAYVWTFDGSQAGITPIPITSSGSPTPPPSGGSNDPQVYFEVGMNMTGHKIRKGSIGVESDDFIVLSQLTDAVTALNESVAAGDLSNADAIAALTTIVNNLPVGITVPEVKALINASVGEAVALEILDDEATRQLIVDAIMAQVAALEASIVARVAALEAVPSLEPRVIALEDAIEAQDLVNANQSTVNADQADVNAATTSALQNIATVNQSQDVRLGAVESRDTAFELATTPIVVTIENGAVLPAETSGVAPTAIVIDNTAPDHITVTANLNTMGYGLNRLSQLYRIINGQRVKFECAVSEPLPGVYTFVFLKLRQGSSKAAIVFGAGSKSI